MPNHNVVLSDQQEALIADLVRSGEFRDADEVLVEGLRLVEESRRDEAVKEQEMRAAIRVGLDEIDAGKFIELADGDAIARHVQSLGSGWSLADSQPRVLKFIDLCVSSGSLPSRMQISPLL